MILDHNELNSIIRRTIIVSLPRDFRCDRNDAKKHYKKHIGLLMIRVYNIAMFLSIGMNMPKTSKEKRGSRLKSTPSKFDDFETNLPRRSLKHKRHDTVIARQSMFAVPGIKKAKMKMGDARQLKKTLKAIGIDNMLGEHYFPSAIDKDDLVFVNPVTLLRKHEGRGLFATKDIPAGTCLGVYTGELYPSPQAFEEYLAQNPSADNSYAMAIGGNIIDAAEKGNFTRYINFSDSQDNVEFVEGKLNYTRVVKVFTTKDIQAGQQFLINYNTYNEADSKYYYFLNPSDGAQSASEMYEEYSSHYQLMTISFDMPLFNLKRNNKLYLTSVGKAILDNELLSDVVDMPDESHINLPFLKTKPGKIILNFDEADAFTPLMMACYLRQFANVKWLIEHHANIDQQQNHSSNCPLFFALEGYSEETEEKAAYVKIMNYLIVNQANVTTHDRADKTFLHKAITVLSDKDFKSIINLLKKQEHIVLSHLFTFVDENDFDVVLTCFNNKDLEKAKILLDAFPEYFMEYKGKNKNAKVFGTESFKKAIQYYSDSEKEYLLTFLSNKKYRVPATLLEDIGLLDDLSSGDEYSYSM